MLKILSEQCDTKPLTIEQTKEKLKILSIVVILYNMIGSLLAEIVQNVLIIQPYAFYIFMVFSNIGMIISVWYGIKIPNIPVMTIEPIEIQKIAQSTKDSALDYQNWIENRVLELKLKIAENRKSIDQPEEYQLWLENSLKEAMLLFDTNQLKTADFVTAVNTEWLKVFKGV